MLSSSSQVWPEPLLKHLQSTDESHRKPDENILGAAGMGF
jgi:hypothetical protein